MPFVCHLFVVDFLTFSAFYALFLPSFPLPLAFSVFQPDGDLISRLLFSLSLLFAECVKAILKQLTLPNFRDEENEPVSDNAISALSKIILAVGRMIDLDD